LSQTERALKSVGELIAEADSRVRQIRQQTDDAKAKIFYWMTPASVLISLVCLWIALSQVSLLVHAWSWWKDPGPKPK
jgi:hypothetical protein